MIGHQQLVNDVKFSPDSRLIASASFDKSIKIWDGKTGSFITTLRGHVQAVYEIAWSADSRLLVSGSADSTLKGTFMSLFFEICFNLSNFLEKCGVWKHETAHGSPWTWRWRLPSIGVLFPNVLFRVAETKFSNCKNPSYINCVFSFLKLWFSPIGGGTEDSSALCSKVLDSQAIWNAYCDVSTEHLCITYNGLKILHPYLTRCATLFIS